MVLAVLGVAPGSMAVRELVAIGQLFGFEDNTVRVAIARLVQGGHVSNEGAAYSLTEGAELLSRWVEEWREGELRIRPWDGTWLCVLHPSGIDRTPRRKSTRSLERLGFRRDKPSLWVRPDNLRKRRDEIERELLQLGLVAGAEVFVGREFSSATTKRWTETLWPTRLIQSGLKASLSEIERSRRTLDSLPDVRALVESFVIGGRGVRRLALDPLLPDEICDGTPRRELTEALLEYDRIGKALWNAELVAPLLARSP